MGKRNARFEIVRSVHVQHEQDVVPDRLPHCAYASRLVRDAVTACLQLDRLVSAADKTSELARVVLVRCPFVVIASGRVAENGPRASAEELVDRHAGELALDVPQRDIDAADCRHDLGALAARQRRRESLASLVPAGTRGRQRKKPLPYLYVGGCVHSTNDLPEPVNPFADRLHRRAMNLAEPREAIIRSDLDENHAHGIMRLVRGPDAALEPVGQSMCPDVFYRAHEMPSAYGVRRAAALVARAQQTA